MNLTSLRVDLDKTSWNPLGQGRSFTKFGQNTLHFHLQFCELTMKFILVLRRNRPSFKKKSEKQLLLRFV